MRVERVQKGKEDGIRVRKEHGDTGNEESKCEEYRVPYKRLRRKTVYPIILAK